MSFLLRLLSSTSLPQIIHRWSLLQDLDTPTVSTYGEGLPKGASALPHPALSDPVPHMLPSLLG